MARTILCTDAVRWLQAQGDGTLGHVVSALPDMDDVGMSQAKYDRWFEKVCRLCLRKASAYVILFQTDRKIDGTWYDKSSTAQRAAAAEGVPLRWHKIVVRREGVDLHRPTYTHLLCFSRRGRPGSGAPDVLPSGPTVYNNGMGLEAIAFVMSFLVAQSGQRHLVVDPFVGRGTAVAAANAFGLDALGVDVRRAQCREAEALVLHRRGNSLSTR